MSLRNPLATARGLGSAKSGTGHWWAQRVSAVALIPLSLWFAVSVLGLVRADYGVVVSWLHMPSTAVLLSLFLAAVFYHAYLGVQVVVEDYVEREWLKLATLLVIKFACILLAAAGVFTALRIAFGA
ncbi:MAG TPA: succinate dehydrogenase, hydrophobic membrane anchor protein [Gammaproteobacteria bacterium]|nr:succinate dehydrogenase, hydrophobic membrane anchor protein [Gammaproteobacteria bacterium]